MRVYKLTTKSDRYSNLSFAAEEDARFYELFDGSSLSWRWTPIKVVPTDEDSADAELADFALLGTIPVFSKNAVSALQGTLLRHGELLPLRSEYGAFYAFNVRVVRDALDEERSELTRFANGEVMAIRRFEFRAEPLEDIEIFKIPQKKRSFVLVTEEFVQRVSAAHLDGFDFTELWRNEHFTTGRKKRNP